MNVDLQGKSDNTLARQCAPLYAIAIPEKTLKKLKKL